MVLAFLSYGAILAALVISFAPAIPTERAARKRLAPDLVPDAELITSELVSNGARASAALEVPAPVGLRLLGSGQRVVIEVWDCGPGMPMGFLARQGGMGGAAHTASQVEEIIMTEIHTAADGDGTMACSCGQAFATSDDLDQHFYDVFVPADDIGTDGRVHAEIDAE